MISRGNKLHYSTTEELFEDSAYNELNEVVQYATDKMMEMRDDISWLKKAVMLPMVKKQGDGGDGWAYFKHGWYSSLTKSFEWLCSSSPYFYVTRDYENTNSLLLNEPAVYGTLLDLKVRQNKM